MVLFFFNSSISLSVNTFSSGLEPSSVAGVVGAETVVVAAGDASGTFLLAFFAMIKLQTLPC